MVHESLGLPVHYGRSKLRTIYYYNYVKKNLRWRSFCLLESSGKWKYQLATQSVGGAQTVGGEPRQPVHQTVGGEPRQPVHQAGSSDWAPFTIHSASVQLMNVHECSFMNRYYFLLNERVHS
jgi:hypothetical protein